MYYMAVRQMVRSLKNLDSILEKTQRQAQARNFDVNNLIPQRLFPDMLPFVAQVRIACDVAKTTASALAGKTPPKHEDNETTFEDLRARIAKCTAYLDTLTEKDFEAMKPDQAVKVTYPPGKALLADEYLLGRQLPNFYFHVATAYAILR